VTDLNEPNPAPGGSVVGGSVVDGSVVDGSVAGGPVVAPDELHHPEGGSDAEPLADAEPRGEVEPSPLDLALAERDQHLNDLQRVSAEFANFRKQTEKRNAETLRLAAVRVVQAILPVLDACDAAAQQAVDGVEPIADQLKKVLEREGLEVINQLEAFDPNRHEAAISEPAAEGQETALVVEVLRTGYAFNGRVLRAAMVRVQG